MRTHSDFNSGMMGPSLARVRVWPSTQTNFYTDVLTKAETDEERETVIENPVPDTNRRVIVQILSCMVTVVRIGQYFYYP